MREIVSKEEVEQMLGFMITDEQFKTALEYAKGKQEYIYSRERRLEVLKRSYLVKLTEEYARSIVFSEFTMDLCRNLRDMEKEHPVQKTERPTSNPIVASSAL